VIVVLAARLVGGHGGEVLD
jgi:hypothetical protein